VDGHEVGNRVILSKIGRYASDENQGEFTDVPTETGRRNLAFSETNLSSKELLIQLASKTTDLNIASGMLSKAASGVGSPGEIRVQVFMTQVTYYGPPTAPQEMVDLCPGIASGQLEDKQSSGLRLGSSSSAPQPWVVDLFTVGAPVVEFIYWYRPVSRFHYLFWGSVTVTIM
jgi:hypothetical protein